MIVDAKGIEHWPLANKAEVATKLARRIAAELELKA
jgi:hypothetical protein